jgi:hypothetical protein
MKTTTIEFPLRLASPLNARVHWTARAKRAQNERAIARTALAHRWTHEGHRAPWPTPTMCALTRIAPRFLDDDNLAGAFKAIRDEVASFFGVDDGPKGPIVWCYGQRHGAKKQYGIEITLQWEDK